MLNFRQQDSECLVTREAVVQITQKLRKRRAENGQERTFSINKNDGPDDYAITVLEIWRYANKEHTLLAN